MRGKEAADLLVLGRHGFGVALEEAGEQGLHHGDQHLVGLRRATVEPLQRGQLRRLPAGGMEAGHLVEDGRRDVGTARPHLVALDAADDVLEEEREPARLRIDLGQVGEGDTGVDPGRHLTVEADLDFVGPQGEAGAPALLVGRGELAHDGARAVAGALAAGIAESEAGGVGHLARADRPGGEVVDPAPRRHGAGLDQRVRQPPRRHVGRGAEQGDRAHGGTRLMGVAGIRLASGPAGGNPSCVVNRLRSLLGSGVRRSRPRSGGRADGAGPSSGCPTPPGPTPRPCNRRWSSEASCAGGGGRRPAARAS